MTGTDARVVFVPLSPSGDRVQPVPLGWLAPAAFIVLIALAESLLGATPGKFALDLKVEGKAGARPGLPGSLARNLLLHAWLPVWFAMPRTLEGAAPALGLAALSLIVLVVGRPDPLYDRWTGVRVRRAG